MPEEKASRSAKHEVEIAVLAKELEHLGKSMDSLKLELSERMRGLTDVVRSFVEIADKKLDRDTYHNDKLELGKTLTEIQGNLSKIDKEHREMEIRQEAIESDRKKIWGLSQNTISFVISILTLISLAAAVVGIFAK